jgi:sphinganine C4-monooxygenase
MANTTATSSLNHLTQTCTPTTLSPLIPGFPDKYALLLLPVIAYWTFSLIFHFCDEYGFLSKYKLHTPAEFLKRNRVSVRDVVKEVLMQHTMQTVLGGIVAYYEPNELTGCEDQDIWSLALRIRSVLSLISNAGIIITIPSMSSRSFSGIPILDGLTKLPVPLSTLETTSTIASLSAVDILLAKALYWLIIPAFQYALAAFFVDTWQYAIHRVMHSYPFMYRTFHSRHHRLYVPYAFGALYNHPLEGFVEDTIGSLLAFKLSRMSVRQGIWFFTLSTLKTVDDHSGFKLPWDPLQWVTDNNAYYHDIHHQSWGMKVSRILLSFPPSSSFLPLPSIFFSRK